MNLLSYGSHSFLFRATFVLANSYSIEYLYLIVSVMTTAQKFNSPIVDSIYRSQQSFDAMAMR